MIPKTSFPFLIGPILMSPSVPGFERCTPGRRARSNLEGIQHALLSLVHSSSRAALVYVSEKSRELDPPLSVQRRSLSEQKR